MPPRLLPLPCLLWIQLFWAALLRPAAAANIRPCPKENRAKSRDTAEHRKVDVSFENLSGVTLNLLWVNFQGAETLLHLLSPDEIISQNSFHGHLFRFRTASSDQLVLDYEVPRSPPEGSVRVRRCEGLGEEDEFGSRARWAEFEGLVHDAAAPCLGPSANWSCVRYISPEEVSKRDKASYGYHEDELKGTPYKAGQTVDHMFAWQAQYLVNCTPYEGGYLKMEMTDRLKQILYPWFEDRRADSLVQHEHIPGGFTNIDRISMDIIHLGRFPKVKHLISQEMQAVLEWWTSMRLRHTETFGVRVYRRGAMLVNHLDRQETHVASAVLQVAQTVDQDGGWPLEVIHPHKPGRKEVYLQPGQMVLYEGARITHGRPMRFRGEEFANIFVHFSPRTWHGVDRSRANPHFGDGREQQEL